MASVSLFYFPLLLLGHSMSPLCLPVFYTYIYLTCSFPLDYFFPSPSLPAAVAAKANTGTVTTSAAGPPGAPGVPPQGAPGSPSPGPALNVPSVNEGTD